MSKKAISQYRPYFLSIILMGLFLVAMTYLTNNFSDLNRSDWNSAFYSDYEYFPMAAFATVMLITMYIVAKVRFRLRTKWPLFIVAIIILALMSVGPFLVYFNHFYYISFQELVRYLTFTWLTILGLYFMVAYFPHMTGGNFLYSLASYFLIGLALFGCVYSYLSETEFYQYIFTHMSLEHPYIVPDSFTSNRNSYSWVLLLGQMAASYLLCRRRRWAYYPIIFFFALNQFFVVSKTGLILSIMFLVGVLAYRYYLAMKKDWHRYLPVGVCILVLTVVVLISVFVFQGPFARLRRYFDWILDVFYENSADSLMTRVNGVLVAWKYTSMNPYSNIFGLGYGLWQEILRGIDPNNFVVMDISYGVALLRGGLVGVALSGLAWLSAFILLIRAIRKKMEGGVTCLLILVAFFARGFIEQGDILALDVASCMIYVMTILPCLAFLSSKKDEKLEQEREKILEKKFTNPKPVFTSNMVPILTLLLTTLLMAFSPVMATQFGVSNFLSKEYFLSLAITMIMFPILFLSYSACDSSSKEQKWMGYILSFLYLFVSIAAPLLASDWRAIGAPIIALVLPLACLFIINAKPLSIKKILGVFVWAVVALLMGALGRYVFINPLFTASPWSLLFGGATILGVFFLVSYLFYDLLPPSVYIEEGFFYIYACGERAELNEPIRAEEKLLISLGRRDYK